MAGLLSRDDRFWAVCLREDRKLIGLIAFNSIDKEKRLDLGHLFHREFAGGTATPRPSSAPSTTLSHPRTSEP